MRARGWRRLAGVGTGMLLAVAITALPRGYGSVTLRAGGWPGALGGHSYLGVVHVHGEASPDSRTTVADLVQVARALNLSFMVLTDHEPTRSAGDQGAHFQDGVLVLTAAEWSAGATHLLDLSAQPGKGLFPSAAAALESCRSRGGPCVAAHPTSRRRPYRSAMGEVQGMEIHSALTGVGDLLAPPYLMLLGTGAEVVLNPGRALWRQGAVDTSAVELWQASAPLPGHRLGTFCGADAHGYLPLKENLLAYLTLITLDQPMSKNPLEAAQQLRDALPAGVCCNALAGAVEALSLTEQDGWVRATGSIRQPLGPARLKLLHDDTVVSTLPLADDIVVEARAPVLPGAWRAEVEVDAPGLLWTLANSAAVALLHVPVPGR